MEITIKGKVYTLISTFHITKYGGKETRGVHSACFIVYDEIVETPNGEHAFEFVTRVLYFNEEDLESIKLL